MRGSVRTGTRRTLGGELVPALAYYLVVWWMARRHKKRLDEKGKVRECSDR